MPLPVFLYALWALWPLAAYPGGKLFAPLVVLLGLFALPSVNLRKLSPPVWAGLLLLVWIFATALWSPASEGLFSGSLQEENFALEASYLRFDVTFIGCFLFVRLVHLAPDQGLRRVPFWIYGGIGGHLVLVTLMALAKDHILVSQGQALVPTGQSLGRNANLLAMAMPLLLGGLLLQRQNWQRAALCLGLLALTCIVTMQLDGLAPLLGLGLAGGVLMVFYACAQRGFRVLFNLVAGGLLLAPVLVWVIGGGGPHLAGVLPLTAQQRLIIWQAALERIMEKPFFGQGVNAARTWTDTYQNHPDLLAQLSPELINHRIIPNHPHNMALQLWAETGLVGAVLAASLLVMIGRFLPAPSHLSLGIKLASAGLFGTALSYFAVSYSIWDESYWASLAIVLSGVIVLYRRSVS